MSFRGTILPLKASGHTDNGCINSRYLDDKAGVASVLAAVKASRDGALTPPLFNKGETAMGSKKDYPLITSFSERLSKN